MAILPLDLANEALPTLAHHAAEVDTSGAFPVQSLAVLRKNGLMGLLVPAEYGGLGGGLPDLVQVAQRLSSACLSTGLIWAMHCQQVAVLARFADRELRDWLMPRIARGELYLASVTTEPGKGGHLLTGVAALEGAGGEMLLERRAPVVTGGDHADGFLITMRASAEARDNELTLVYADRSQLTIESAGGWDAMGMRGTGSVPLTLKAALPGRQVVGEPGHFRTAAVETMIPYGHVAWASCWLGTARGALADYVALVRSPRGPSIDPGSELVRDRLARIRIDLEVVGAYLGRVVEEIMRLDAASESLGNPATQIHLNTLKVVAAENTFGAVNRLVQLAGMSLGYRRGTEVPLERHFRDLRSASLNYADDRLLMAIGAQTVLDRTVVLA